MTEAFFISKEIIKDKIEPFIYAELNCEKYAAVAMDARHLLTANRFDLGLKLAYLSYRDVLPTLARAIYKNDIRSQTLGRFEEYGNVEKSSFNDYIDHFDTTFNDISENGFDERKTLVPLSSSGSIMNGAHRVSSAIFLGKDIVCLKTDLDDVSPNYQYFIDRKVPEEILDIGAVSFCDYAHNTYIAFLWPSGRHNIKQTELLFPNVVYKKNITLNSNGGLNLLIELYKHMDWIGTKDRDFPGARQKLMECFTDFDAFTVILFQCESLERVQEIKKQVRDINNIGFSSVHITDTEEEVRRISRLVFNKNGLHFLNFAQPYRFQSSIKMLESLLALESNSLSKLVLGGGMTLSIYGLREASDIDYYSDEVINLSRNVFEMDPHDSQLKYHKVSKQELIYNPAYHFEFLGVKFVSFKQTYKFKKDRNETKDINDCKIMKSLVENHNLRLRLALFKQKIFYRNLILKRRLRIIFITTLKIFGIYEVIKKAYHKFKGLM